MKNSTEDTIRAYAGIFSTLGMLVVPLIVFLIGLIVWGTDNLKFTILLTLGAFALFFLVSIVAFKGIKHPSVFISVLPFILGMIYQISPIDIPLPVDDTLVQLAGSTLSFLMLKRANPELPGWTFLAMAASSIYDLLGIAIPGPIDELLVQILALYGVSRANQRPRSLPPEDVSPR